MSSGRTLICSVLFLDIVEYSKRPVDEQIELKQAFNRFLSSALSKIAPRNRIVLDTGDGAAVMYPGAPEDALYTAIYLRNTVSGLAVRLGINLGPVRLVRDINRQTSVIGDGINVAQRVMGFAAPGQLLVSRSYYEVVACLAREYESLFRHEGSRTDKHIREHEIYALVDETPEARRLIDATLRAKLHNRRTAWLTAVGPFGIRSGALYAAPLAFLATFGAAMSIHVAPPSTPVAVEAPPTAPAEPAKPAASTEPAAPVKPAPAAAEPSPPAKPKAVEASPPAKAKARPASEAGSPPARPAAPKTAKRSPRKRSARPAAERAAGKEAPVVDATSSYRRPPAAEPAQRPAPATPRPPALIHLALAPWGEVIVDGKSRGYSPPLRSVEVTPGKHTVVIRNTAFPSHVERIDVRSGDRITIRHKFQ